MRRRLQLVEGMARRGYSAKYTAWGGRFTAHYSHSDGSSYHWSIHDALHNNRYLARTLAGCQEEVNRALALDNRAYCTRCGYVKGHTTEGCPWGTEFAAKMKERSGR